jgi:hypothetical protein
MPDLHAAMLSARATQTPEIVVVATKAVKFPSVPASRGAGGTRRIFTFFGSFGHFIAVTKAGRLKFLSIVRKLDQTPTQGTADLKRYRPWRIAPLVRSKMLRNVFVASPTGM